MSIGPRNISFVCFDCRTSVKRGRWNYRDHPRCQHCSSQMVKLEFNDKVPPKRSNRKWKSLLQTVQTRSRDVAFEKAHRRITRRWSHLMSFERRDILKKFGVIV